MAGRVGWLEKNWEPMSLLARKMAWNRRRQESTTSDYTKVLSATDVEDVIQQAAKYWLTRGEDKILFSSKLRAVETGRPVQVELAIYWVLCVKTAIKRWRAATGAIVTYGPEAMDQVRSMETAEDTRELVLAIRQLEVSDRAKAILLATAAGYKQEEIAKAMGITQQAVSKNLETARSALAKVLAA